LSYVSIWKPVNDRIVQASRESEDEIIGLLLGRLESNTLIIEDSITGEFRGEPNRVTLPPSTLAKIADDLLTGRAKGNIVGWYHSHTEAGLGFSETDVQTQRNLQQFSSLITAMVVDAETGDVGYFRVDRETAEHYRIPDERITVFENPSEAVRPEAKAEAQDRIQWAPQRPLAVPKSSWYMTAIVVCAILAIGAAVAIIALIFHAKFGSFFLMKPAVYQVIAPIVR
jgi:proteasome lid subunit RPN8/RPN11